jgi:[ribosomal protein S18]-alanine N-acetyltransferase
LKTLRIEPMRPEDLPEVMAIEEQTFPVPWSRQNFLHELRDNPFSRNLVVRSGASKVVAYANVWVVDRELRINNVAVLEASRRQGYGAGLMRHLLDQGRNRGCLWASLEVRPSNLPALRLYEKLGFRVVARRKGYYSDTREDALVMRVDL